MEKILLIQIESGGNLKMDTSSLKNIVVLKDLPSNIVEEAIVVLKENQKIQKLELIDKSKKQNKEQSQVKTISEQGQKPKDYIIKEAQMLISDYISRIENRNKTENQSIQNLKKKYKKLKNINYILIAGLILTAVIQFII